jgi:hypothetical protein
MTGYGKFEVLNCKISSHAEETLHSGANIFNKNVKS